jgi:2'-5' RNA ligase
MARLFIAVWPTDDVAAELTSLHRKDQRGVRFVRPENWHITLRFLGDSNPDDVTDALDGTSLAAARARLGPAVDLLDERALVVPVQGLDSLARTVNARTAHIGEPPRKRFIGHLTIARVKPRVPMPRTIGALVSAAFDVDEIALVRSRLDPDGARYETIQTWPTGGQTPIG